MLLEKYNKIIKKELKEELCCSNIMQIPRLQKICVNVGWGVVDSNISNYIIKDISLITGQKPLITQSKKSISNFKLRQKMNIGCKVTLRSAKMYHFMERLCYIALPRSRDFRGISIKSFDGRGNLSFGIREHIIFPEVSYSNIGRLYGMDISFIVNSNSDKESFLLLKKLGLPFANSFNKKDEATNNV